MQTTLITHFGYFLTFIDDHTKFTIVSFLKEKLETLAHLKAYRTLVDNQLTMSIKMLCTYNGGEFMSKKSKEYLQENGIYINTWWVITLTKTEKLKGKISPSSTTQSFLLKATNLADILGRSVSMECYPQNQ